MIDKYLYMGAILIWNAILLVITFLSLKGRIHFGWGMADIVLLGIILITLLIVDVIFVFSLKETSFFFHKKKLIIGIGLIFLIYICLQMTLLRGPASPWNGNIFF
jgi:hypothetical protein